MLPSRRSRGAEAGIAELRRISRAGGGQRQGKTRALAILYAYPNGLRAQAQHMPEPLLDQLKRSSGRVWQSRGRRLPAVRYTI